MFVDALLYHKAKMEQNNKNFINSANVNLKVVFWLEYTKILNLDEV